MKHKRAPGAAATAGRLMELTEILALISRWLHIVPAIIFVGGTLFMRLSLVPAATESGAPEELRESIRRRWSKLVMVSVLLLLVSGLYNTAIKAMGFELSGVYNTLLLIKIVLALAVFYLAAVLSGRSATAQRFRERETHWLNVLCVLMIAIVMIAGYMKMNSSEFKKKVKPVIGSVKAIPDSSDEIAARDAGWPGVRFPGS